MKRQIWKMILEVLGFGGLDDLLGITDTFVDGPDMPPCIPGSIPTGEADKLASPTAACIALATMPEKDQPEFQ